MTQIFSESGEMIPVTVVEAGPATVTQVKTEDTDGYSAVQIAFGNLKESRSNKPTKGHFDKWNSPLKKHLTEIRLEEGESYENGQIITVEYFEEGSLLDVTGTSKGKGTQGNIKRHGHHRGPMTHGSKHKRLAGALAGASYPGRVFKGNNSPGRMGRDTITVQNVELVKVIPERHIMLIKGALPGKKGGLLKIQYAVKDETAIEKSIKAKDITPQFTESEEDKKAKEKNKSKAKKDKQPKEEPKKEAEEAVKDLESEEAVKTTNDGPKAEKTEAKENATADAKADTKADDNKEDSKDKPKEEKAEDNKDKAEEAAEDQK